MVRLRLTGGTKTETTSRGEETGDQVDLIDLQGDSAQGQFLPFLSFWWFRVSHMGVIRSLLQL